VLAAAARTRPPLAEMNSTGAISTSGPEACAGCRQDTPGSAHHAHAAQVSREGQAHRLRQAGDSVAKSAAAYEARPMCSGSSRGPWRIVTVKEGMWALSCSGWQRPHHRLWQGLRQGLPVARASTPRCHESGLDKLLQGSCTESNYAQPRKGTIFSDSTNVQAYIKCLLAQRKL
jgi:hypothetical protein